MALKAFSPPGRADDLSDAGQQAWSRDLAGRLIRERTGRPGADRPQFFNPLGVELDADAAEAVMRWVAFPRKLARVPAPRRYELGEDRDQQEEYCEWAGARDVRGQLVRAMFTSEVPEYYHLLARDDPERLLAVYREHVSPDAQPRDLVAASGTYLPRNRWNIAGAMHMVQTFNTLNAAIVLVAEATVVRDSGSGLLTNPNDLIRCGISADMDRNSDPLIVGDVNALARAGADVTLADPIGLYLDDELQTSGWETPDGSDPAEFWRITRGEPGHALRAVYEVPADRGFTVSDIRINGRPITSPSQIAESIQVQVVGLAHRFGRSEVAPRRCAGASAVELAAELPPIDDLIAAAGRTR